jgi:hypothetical protein
MILTTSCVVLGQVKNFHIASHLTVSIEINFNINQSLECLQGSLLFTSHVLSRDLRFIIQNKTFSRLSI